MESRKLNQASVRAALQDHDHHLSKHPGQLARGPDPIPEVSLWGNMSRLSKRLEPVPFRIHLVLRWGHPVFYFARKRQCQGSEEGGTLTLLGVAGSS